VAAVHVPELGEGGHDHTEIDASRFPVKAGSRGMDALSGNGNYLSIIRSHSPIIVESLVKRPSLIRNGE
jgi:hypothetical protein